jgi:hypothetical protein
MLWGRSPSGASEAVCRISKDTAECQPLGLFRSQREAKRRVATSRSSRAAVLGGIGQA